MAITTRRVDLEISVYATLWFTNLVISVSTADDTAGERGGQVGNREREFVM